MKRIGIISLILLLGLTGCKTKYVSVPEYHYETITKTDSFMQRDSVFFYDSIYVEKNGDTITTYKTKILYRDRWRDRIVRDSIIKVDSIRVPYPVERNLTKWEKMKMDLGGILIVTTIVGILIIVFSLFIYLKKRGVFFHV